MSRFIWGFAMDMHIYSYALNTQDYMSIQMVEFRAMSFVGNNTKRVFRGPMYILWIWGLPKQLIP